MGALMRSVDWGTTPLGPVDRWPQSLRSVLSILLTSPSPLFLWWGPEFIQFYNDAYRPIMGGLHPRGLGQRGPECWGEAWKLVYPLVEAAMERGQPSSIAEGMLPLVRHGFVEECYFDYTYTPVRIESGAVGGIFCAVTEVTQRIVGARRMRMLRELALSTGASRSVEHVLRATEKVLAQASLDVPFALLYCVDGRRARLLARSGLSPESPAARSELPLDSEAPWPLEAVARSGQEVRVEDLGARFGALPAGAWPEPITQALLLPVPGTGDEATYVLVVGVSPRRPLDEAYRSFLQLLARQVASDLSSARAYEQERRRAEALAELNGAKTAFFNNVSHEFRTPLTLMLGPLEDALQDGAEPLGPAQRERLVLVQRGGARLLKLVNALLDYSRLEAGRAQPAFEQTDLSALTRELVSHFESAAQRSGLTLSVRAPPLSEPVWVDREAWAQVVFNLLSNALKHTFEGGIFVSLAFTEDAAELQVRDTGTGIPEKELPRLFERFHRVEGARARSQEGTGIGLALVHELVKLHGGRVDVRSAPGRGSTFIVRVPRGFAHLPAEHLRARQTLEPVSARARPHVEGALGEQAPEAAPGPVLSRSPGTSHAGAATEESPAEPRARVLLADDNADLREYIAGLLRPSFDVEAVADGEAALSRAREHRPDLILSDVMMPGLDGFSLLREVRADAGLRAVPFILLSARAGEEASVGGLEAGADDYLVKPFGSRELLARVRSMLELARMRREAARQEALAVSLKEAVRARDEFLSVASHELKTPLAGFRLNLDLLQRGLSAETKSRVGERFAAAGRQVQRLASLVETLLDVSHATTGRLQLMLDTVDLAPLVTEAVARMREELERAGSPVTLDVAPSVVGGYDRMRLDQVVTNLLSNAMKYGAGKPIEVVLERTGDRARLRVTDHGIGIAREDRERIFERFERAVPVRHYGGLGLGLWIARQIVEAHGGSIAVTDTPGGGATFRVELPAAGGSPAEH
nr:ATP-binding protein [Pyxidicoccus fallax]